MTTDRAGWELIWRSNDIPPRYRSFADPNATVVEWADTLPDGGYVLDVGCGVGRHMVYLGGRGFRVAGVDISPTGIELARKACAEHGITFEGQVSGMDRLPWEDDTFDGALSTSTIHHLRREGIMKALNEVKRVLKPGGTFIADFPCTDTLEYQGMRRQVAAGELTEVEPNTFVDLRPITDPMDDLFLPHHFCDEADVRDLMSGFEILKLWPGLRDVEKDGVVVGKRGKWVVVGRKPSA
jgi:tellurite methyltransferase